MALIKKNTGRRSSVKNAENKAVIITKSKWAGSTSFPKKVKSMNTLLGKATLLEGSFS